MAERSSFPSDPIERHRVMVAYDITPSFYDRQLAPRLSTWRVGRAAYHSERELRRVLATLAQFEPPRPQTSEKVAL